MRRTQDLAELVFVASFVELRPFVSILFEGLGMVVVDAHRAVAESVRARFGVWGILVPGQCSICCVVPKPLRFVGHGVEQGDLLGFVYCGLCMAGVVKGISKRFREPGAHVFDVCFFLTTVGLFVFWSTWKVFRELGGACAVVLSARSIGGSRVGAQVCRRQGLGHCVCARFLQGLCALSLRMETLPASWTLTSGRVLRPLSSSAR